MGPRLFSRGGPDFPANSRSQDELQWDRGSSAAEAAALANHAVQGVYDWLCEREAIWKTCSVQWMENKGQEHTGFCEEMPVASVPGTPLHHRRTRVPRDGSYSSIKYLSPSRRHARDSTPKAPNPQ